MKSYAVVFPGQGSQAVGMLGSLLEQAPVVAQTFAEAQEALGYDLSAVIANGPKEVLDQTEITQPALLAAGVAVWRVWQQRSLSAPSALAGHSLGEYTALVAAGSLQFADALRLVQLRGQLMQTAVPSGQGGMVALIGMDDAKVREACAKYPGTELLAPANFNCPGQVVVAGQTAALEWLLINAKSLGARMAMRVGMSVPSHCALLRGAADFLAEALAKIEVRSPQIPVWHNQDAQPHSAPDEIRAALAAQLYEPVQWTKTMAVLSGAGINTWLEAGPGKVLSGLIKRGTSQAQIFALEDPISHESAAAYLLGNNE